MPAWSERERLQNEKQSLGFYLSGHPFNAYRDELRRFARTPLANLMPQHEPVALAGVIYGVVVRNSRRGRMAVLKVLRQIVPADQIVTELLTLLDLFDTEYMRNPEPKIQVITMLSEHKTAEVREAVEPFLNDVNESVRFHAAGTIFAMSDPEALPPLLEALGQEESLRVKNRIARGIEQAGWEIPEALRQQCEAALPPGYSLRSGKVIGTAI